MANQNSKNKNANNKAKNTKPKTNKTNSSKTTNAKATENKKVVAKSNDKKETKVVVKEEKVISKNKKEEKVLAKKVEVKEEKKSKEKKSFSLTSKQKDIILIALAAVLLVVALVITGTKKEKLDIELPVALEGAVGFTEITYSEYEQKINEQNPFLVVIVKDGCGYCEQYEPILEEVAGEYNLPINYINLTNLNEEEYNLLSKSNRYLKTKEWGTPTTLFMYGNTVVDSIGGYVDKDTFLNFAKENFKVNKDGE